jgi:hypothetical protein
VTFNQQLLLAVVEKLLLGGVLLGVGLWANKRLEAYRGKVALASEVAKKRVEAAARVWRAVADLEKEWLHEATVLAGLFYAELRAAEVPNVPPVLPTGLPARLAAIGQFQAVTLPGPAVQRITTAVKPSIDSALGKADAVFALIQQENFWLEPELGSRFAAYVAEYVKAFAELEPGSLAWPRFASVYKALQERRPTAKSLLPK